MIRSGGYRSDYDILVVVNDARLTDPVEYWGKADDRLLRDAAITETLTAPVNFIVHDPADVNDQLARGRPFFVDIAWQGVALYEAEGFELGTPRALAPDAAQAEARKHFEYWSSKVASAVRGAVRYAEDGERNDAVFTLHQAAERAYHCVLLTLTLYSPLCRARHKGLYAARRTMPSGRGIASSAKALATIGAA